MTDKERLEEIESKLISWKTEELESTIVDFWPKDIRDVEWLIEQAGRVQELEEEIEDWRKEVKKWQMFFREESQQNKRLREALEFYADEDNYREHDLKGIVPPRPIAYKPILHDYGSIARKALEGEK